MCEWSVNKLDIWKLSEKRFQAYFLVSHNYAMICTADVLSVKVCSESFHLHWEDSIGNDFGSIFHQGGNVGHLCPCMYMWGTRIVVYGLSSASNVLTCIAVGYYHISIALRKQVSEAFNQEVAGTILSRETDQLECMSA